MSSKLNRIFITHDRCEDDHFELLTRVGSALVLKLNIIAKKSHNSNLGMFFRIERCSRVHRLGVQKHAQWGGGGGVFCFGQVKFKYVRKDIMTDKKQTNKQKSVKSLIVYFHT